MRVLPVSPSKVESRLYVGAGASLRCAAAIRLASNHWPDRRN